jgi:small subunit ribosomal protein S16
MLRIRLSRTGKKRQPSYRVVVAEKEAKRDGRVVERIGHYNPLAHPAEYQIQEDRALYWMSVGAHPSDAVRLLLEKQGTFERLARLRGGESIESLVAEYQGVAVPVGSTTSPAAEAAVAEAAAAVAAVEAVALAIDEEE